MRGIDISHWESDINPVRSDVDFVIVKATEGLYYTDPSFTGFANKIVASGKPFGFYHFARENSPEDEAKWFYDEVKSYLGKGIPILDYETENSSNKSWCERFIKKFYDLSGRYCMLYISAYRCSQYSGSWITDKCALWLAGYPYGYDQHTWLNGNPPYNYSPWSKCAIWQFTSVLRLSGYGENVDGNLAYISVAEWNALAGKSGGDEPITPGDKSVTKLALEVVCGKWGNGEDRRKRLTAAGYNYNQVQDKVNEAYTIARQVINGDWGNGWNRKQALIGAGYDYDLVQTVVNLICAEEGIE